MNLEKEINQKKPFKSEFHKATANLVFTHNWLSVRLKKFLKPYGCTLQQYNVLRILKGAREPISTSEIRSRMIEKMADTSRLVERLNLKGWVNRQACCEDKRLVDVTISEAGIEFLSAIDTFNEYVEGLYKSLNDEDLQHLNLILNKLRKA